MAHQLRHDDYTVGWVCALPIELAAAQEMLDEKHPYLKLDPADDDKNLYAFGSIGEYNIVIMCLPTGQIGNNPAAAVATQMRATFENIKFGLLVGIGGGVPSDEADVRLGDVVVSQPRRVVAGVMQYDVGTATPSGFERIGAVNSPPQILLAAVTRVRVNKLRGRSKLSDYVSNLERRIATFQRVKAGPDILFEGTYDHSGGKTCDQCSVDRQVARHLRESKDEVVVHYGTIASGNQVMRNAAERDRVSAELGGVLCFEMEAAGLMNSFPCLVVRGICDYSDSHRNKLWRPYAAATAAAYAKELLSTIPSVDIAKSRTVQGVMWSAYSQYNDDSSMDLVHGHDTTDRDSQPSSPWYSFLQEALTAPTMASHTHGFSNKIWSSTGKVSEVITDATSHTTQDSAFEPPNQSRETAPSKLTMARPVNRPYETSRRATFKTATFKTATFETITRWDKGRIDKLAKQLFGVVNCPGVAQAALDRVSESLPDLLRAFAVKVDYQFQSHMHLDVMFYVQKLRVSVQQSFQRLVDDASQPEEAAKADEGLGKDAIDRFMNDTDGYDDVPEQQFDAETVELEQNQKQQEDNLEEGVIFDFMLQTPAYEWLVARLKRETTLVRARPDLMEQIGAQIRGMLLAYGEEINRKTSSQEYKATFELLWSPLQYLKDQQSHDDPEEVLGGAITLTGTGDDAQALTALEYLCQVWPESGMYFMKLITDAVCRVPEHRATATLSDGTELRAQIDGGKLKVNVIGSSESVVEAGQQLAWLGAALRPSPFETGIAYCTPYIRDCYPMHNALAAESSGQRHGNEIFCQLDFKVRAPYMAGPEGPGLCWHAMFTSPILVDGFPILSKPEPQLGLEMPLDLLAGMIGAPQVLGIQGKVFLKGFATMLVGVKRLDDLLIWHFSFDKEGKRISYLDIAHDKACDMDVDQLDDIRHVVGWSSDSLYYAGAKDADYDIKGTGLPSPDAGTLLEKFTFTLGKIFTVGATIAPRVRQISPRFDRDAYEQKLMWIEENYVVLWDEETKRGWLTNGTSALLHLIRMSLALYKEKGYCDVLLFDESGTQNAPEHDPTSAREFFKNKKNRRLEVWCGMSEDVKETEWEPLVKKVVKASQKTKKSSYLFENFVTQKLSVLEVLIDTHKKLASQSGIKLDFGIRKQLEGWNFRDLAGEGDPKPRVTTLQAIGYGWVDFIHSVDAITLFGRGFGDIIRPSKSERICSQWSQLPKGEYHLAASLYDLNNIMGNSRNTERGDIEIVPGLLWHSPMDPFTPCRCLDHRNFATSRERCIKNHNPVQSFFPKGLIRGSILFPRPRKPENLNDRGAVIFGHTMSWSYAHEMNEISEVSSERRSSPHPSNPRKTVPESNILVTSLSLDQSSSKRLKRTYRGVTYASRSVDTKTAMPENSTSRHAGSSLANSQNYQTDSSEEDMEEPDDNCGKMWWEISQLPKLGPRKDAATEDTNKMIREV